MESSNEEANIKVGLIQDEIDVNSAVKWLTDSKCGAIEVFLGTTRDTEMINDNQLNVLYLDYYAYNGMAIKLMKRILLNAIKKNPEIKKCILLHRIGPVHVGQCSVFVGVTTGHRCQDKHIVMGIVNAVKSQVTVWKRIVYEENDKNNDKNEWSNKSQAFWLENSNS